MCALCIVYKKVDTDIPHIWSNVNAHLRCKFNKKSGNFVNFVLRKYINEQ